MGSTFKILGVFLLCSIAFQLSLSVPLKPNNCGKYDCPAYRVEKSNADYEIRVYTAGQTWIETTYKANIFANYILFRRLFNYINGGNDEVSKFNMTVPVLMKTEDGQKTMMFYLGKGNFPKPTESEVKMVKTKENKVFVRNYESYWFFGEKMNAMKLKASLEKDNANFKSNFYYSVGYNRPLYFQKSYKEVWYSAADSGI